MTLNAVALGELAAPCHLWVPTVHDLVNSSERLWPGREVAALGLHRPGDGGGGIFRFTVDNVVTDGGIMLARQSGKGSWIRQIRTAALSPEMFGMGGDPASGEGAALQALLDAAGRNGAAAVLTSGKTYMLDRALFIRTSGVRLMGNGSTLVLAQGDIKGSVLTICNASDIHVEALNIDVAGHVQNGFVLIGNSREFPEVIALGPPAPVRNVTLRNIAIANARFHINRREAVILAAPLAGPRIGDMIDGTDSIGRPVEGSIFEIAPDGLRLTVDWRINRVHPFTMLTLRRNGSRALVRERVSVPVREPFSGIDFASWNGKYNGKGLSIQRACSQVRADDIRTTDCDIGLTLEAHPPAPDNGVVDIIMSNVEIVRASRAAIWVHSSAGQSQGAMQAGISNVRIQDACASGDRMGIISLDRAANVAMEDIAINFTAPPPATPNFAIIRGLFTRCTFDNIRFDGPAECGVAYEPHARWGKAPGDFTINMGNNRSDMTIRQPHALQRLVHWHGDVPRPVESIFRFGAPSAFSAAQRSLPANSDPSILVTTSMIGPQ
ncbi:hypothetical protein [Sphingobium aquiterrae]|uniref:hypothetical protein n=1 Tax=Sphingobium aquiterrae TaxID=2038656 RepID=UPI00301673F5